jgi:hypothetical protein
MENTKRPRRRWEHNIELDLKETWCEGDDSSSSEQGPVVGSCEHSNEISGPIKGVEFRA